MLALVAAVLPVATVLPAETSESIALDVPVELRVDRAPIALVLGQLAAAGELDGTRLEGVDETRLSGPLAGSLRAVLAGLVADHRLVLDIVDGTLDARPDAERRAVVLDVSRPASRARQAMTRIERMPAARLPGNLVVPTERGLVIAGHPAFVARAEAMIATVGIALVGQAVPAPAASAIPSATSSTGTDGAGDPAADVPLASKRKTDPGESTATASRAPDLIRSVDDVPGFY